MSRRFKLFATVISLCFSIAVLMFGVYAATSVTYNVTGSVTYQVEGVHVELTTKVYRNKSTTALTKATDTIYSALSTSSFEQIAQRGDVELVKEIDTFTTAGKGEVDLTCNDLAVGIEINFGKYDSTTELAARKGYVYYIVTSFNNLSETGSIKAYLQTAPTTIANTWQNNVGTVTGVDPNNIVVSYGLDQLSTAINNVSFNYVIKVEQDVVPNYEYIKYQNNYYNLRSATCLNDITLIDGPVKYSTNTEYTHKGSIEFVIGNFTGNIIYLNYAGWDIEHPVYLYCYIDGVYKDAKLAIPDGTGMLWIVRESLTNATFTVTIEYYCNFLNEVRDFNLKFDMGDY